VKQIERHLGVARSSVSRWVREVRLGADERRALAARVTDGRLQAAVRKAAAARELRREYQEEGRSLARERGASYATGCMLYWAEGEKSRTKVAVANSDPDLLAFFAGFLREHFAVGDEAMTIYCNLFADHVQRQQAIEAFWLRSLGLTRESLRKSTVNS